jgi:hypothetical protein
MIQLKLVPKKWWPGRSPQTIPVTSGFGLESNDTINPSFSFMIPGDENTTTENHTCADVYDTSAEIKCRGHVDWMFYLLWDFRIWTCPPPCSITSRGIVEIIDQ